MDLNGSAHQYGGTSRARMATMACAPETAGPRSLCSWTMWRSPHTNCDEGRRNPHRAMGAEGPKAFGHSGGSSFETGLKSATNRWPGRSTT